MTRDGALHIIFNAKNPQVIEVAKCFIEGYEQGEKASDDKFHWYSFFWGMLVTTSIFLSAYLSK